MVALEAQLSPDVEARAQRIARERGLPLDAVRLTLSKGSPTQQAAIEHDYDAMLRDVPRTQAWLRRTQNRRLTQDDIDTLVRVSRHLGAVRKPRGLWDEAVSRTAGGFVQLQASGGHLLAALGGDQEYAISLIAAAHRDRAEREAGTGAATARFRREFQEAEGLDIVTTALSSPRQLGILVAENLGFSAPPLVGGAAGALGGPLGIAAGVTAGGTLVEFGAWVDQRIAESGYDLSDEAQLRAAYSDSELLSKIRAEALRKGLGTSLVDGLSAFFGGAAVRKATGLRRVAAVGRELGTQTVLEGVGEAAGQIAATGTADVNEAIRESVAALGQSAGEIILGASARAGPAAARAARRTTAAREAHEQATEGVKANRDSKLHQRSPEAAQAHADAVLAEDDGSRGVVVLTRDELEAHYVAEGRTPVAGIREDFGEVGVAAYTDGAETGHVEIPGGLWFSSLAAKPELEVLNETVRFGEDSLSLREAQALESSIDTQLGAALDGQRLYQSREKLTQRLDEVTQEIAAAEEADVGGNTPVSAPGQSPDIAGQTDTGPDLPTLYAEQTALTEQLGQIRDIEERTATTAAQLGSQVAEQLVAAGRGKRVAQDSAELIVAAFSTLSERSGIPLDELVRRFPIRVQRATGAAPSGALEQSEVGDAPSLFLELDQARKDASRELKRLKRLPVGKKARQIEAREIQIADATKALERAREELEREYPEDIAKSLRKQHADYQRAVDGERQRREDALAREREVEIIRRLDEKPRLDALRRRAQGGLRRLGYRLERSDGGSNYYAHESGDASKTVRLSDHRVPMTAARFAGGFTWADGTDQFIIDLDTEPSDVDAWIKSLDRTRLEQQSRGFIEFGAPGEDGRREFIINLMSKANSSTFLHESGHAFLELLGDLSTETPALQQDYQTVLDWLGVESREQIETEHHEKFARGFEQYLRSGRAPSAGLRRVFAAFRDWLTRLYRTARALDVELTDDVRHVMDRLLATDAELEAVGYFARATPVPEEVLAALTPEQRAEYEDVMRRTDDGATAALDQAQLKDLDRQRKALRSERMAQLVAEAEAEVIARPEGQALAAAGESPIARASVPEDIRERLDALGILAADGVDFGMFTEDYGLGAPDTAVAALEKAADPLPEARKIAAGRLRTEMQATGQLLDPAEAKQIAREAQTQRDRAELAEAKLRIYRDAQKRAEAGQRAERADAAREREAAAREAARKAAEVAEIMRSASKREVEGVKEELLAAVAEEKRRSEIHREAEVRLREAERQERADARAEQAADRRAAFDAIPNRRDIAARAERRLARASRASYAPHRFLSAAKRESTAAAARARVGDYEGAAKHTEYERINVELHRVAMRLKRRDAQRERTLKRLAKGFRKGKNTEAAKQLTRYRGAARHVLAILHRFGLAEVEEHLRQPSQSLADWVRARDAEGRTLAVPDFLLAERTEANHLELTSDQFEALYQFVRGVQHLAREDGKALTGDRTVTREARKDEMVAHLGETFGDREVRTPAGSSTKTEKFKAWLRGKTAEGTKASILLRMLDGDKDGGPFTRWLWRETSRAADRSAERTRQYQERVVALRKEHFTEDELASLADTRKSRRDFAGVELAHDDRLGVLGLMGSVEGRQRLSAQFTEQQIQAVLDASSASDLAYVRARWELLGELFPEMVAQQERIAGQSVKPVEPMPFDVRLADGSTVTMPGGYHTISYQDTASRPGRQNAEADAFSDVKNGVSAVQALSLGMFKARVAEVEGGKLRLDEGVIVQHLTKTLHTLSMREAILDANALLNDKELVDEIEKRAGVDAVDQLRKWLARTAAGSIPVASRMDEASLYLRRGAVVSLIGARAKTALMQFYGLRQSVVRIGAGATLRGITRVASDLGGAHELAQEKSSLMRERPKGSWQREMHELGQRLASKPASWMEHAAFYLVSKTQYAVDLATWHGAYEAALADMPDGSDPLVWDDEAVFRADTAVRDSQSSGLPVDMSFFEGGTPMYRLMTTFFTEASLKLNLTRLSKSRTIWSDPASVIKFVGDMFLLYFFEAAGIGLIAATMGDDDDESGTEAFVRGSLGALVDTYPFLRELSGPLKGYPYRGPAGLVAFGAATSAIQQVNQGEIDTGLAKSLNRLGGSLLAYPSSAINEYAEAVGLVLEGRVAAGLGRAVGIRADD